MDRKSDSHHFFIVRLLLYRNSLPFFGLIQVEAFMIGDSKTHEWNLLKERFDALVRNKGLRQDSLEQFLDNAIRYRCGRFIAWAAETKTKANHGAWPPDLRRANEVTPFAKSELTRISRR